MHTWPSGVRSGFVHMAEWPELARCGAEIGCVCAAVYCVRGSVRGGGGDGRRLATAAMR